MGFSPLPAELIGSLLSVLSPPPFLPSPQLKASQQEEAGKEATKISVSLDNDFWRGALIEGAAVTLVPETLEAWAKIARFCFLKTKDFFQLGLKSCRWENQCMLWSGAGGHSAVKDPGHCAE